MTGNRNAWRAPLAGLASVAMLATMGVAAGTANAAGAGTVTLNANGGTINSQPTMAYGDAGDQGGADGKLSQLYDEGHTPVLDGYTFTGWYTSESLGGKAVSVADTVTPNSTLYAHWTADKTENTVTFAGVTSWPAPTTAGFGDNKYDFATANSDGWGVVLAQGDHLADWQVPDNESVEYDGWVNTADGTKVDFETLTTNGEKAVVLERNQVTDAVFYTFPSAWNVSKVQLAGKKFADKTAKVALPASADFPTVYYTNGNGKAVKVTKWTTKPNDPASEAAKDDKVAGATLYAKPSAETKVYRADLYFKDASDNASDQNNNVKDPDYAYLEGSKYATVDTKALADYEKADGYTFDDWYTDFTNSNTKLSKQTYGAVFNAEGGIASVYGAFEADSDTVEVTFDPYYDGAEKTVKTLTEGAYFGNDLPVPTRDGYVFQGWYKSTSLDNDANKVTKDTKVADFDSKADGKTTVYAKWQNASYAEIDELLSLQNVDPKLYTTNSYNAYDKVRNEVVKQIKKDYGSAVLTEAQVGSEAKAYTTYTLKKGVVSDEDLQSYVSTLRAAQANLQVLPEVEGTYTDVNELTPHYTDIWNLTARGVVKGYADKTFRPMDGLNRQDFAAYLYRLAGEPEFDPAKATKTFADVDASTPHYKAIMWAASKGIVNGYPDGSFKGMDLINRQDAAAMLYRLAGSPTYTVNFGAFVDVDSTTPHYKEILWAASEGIVRGYANGTFNGYSTIVRQDAAAFLQRMVFPTNHVAEYLK